MTDGTPPRSPLMTPNGQETLDSAGVEPSPGAMTTATEDVSFRLFDDSAGEAGRGDTPFRECTGRLVPPPPASVGKLDGETSGKHPRQLKVSPPMALLCPPGHPSAPGVRGFSSESASPTDYCLVPKWKRAQKKLRASSAVDPDRPSIYDRGVRSLIRATQKVEEMRAAQLQHEAREATFRPQISARAQSLRRDPGRDGSGHALMRKRLLMLELPCGPPPGEATGRGAQGFTPRISEQSEKIVRRSRSASAAFLPAGERLYRDARSRVRALAEIAEEGSHRRSGSAARRSEAEIKEHIDSLYRYQAKRQKALEEVREQHLRQQCAERPVVGQPLHVDPAQVVERLLCPPTPRQPRNAALSGSATDLVFAPKTNPASEQMIALARERGLAAWFDYFSPASGEAAGDFGEGAPARAAAAPTLTVRDLCAYAGPCAEVAWYAASVLEDRSSSPEERGWTSEAFVAALARHEARHRGRPQIWREKPPAAESGGAADRGPRGMGSTDATFRPALNPRSERITQEKKDDRPGPAYARLFLSAKVRQLGDRQRELEEVQQHLAEAAAEQERRSRTNARWRSRNPPAPKTEERRPEVAVAEPLQHTVEEAHTGRQHWSSTRTADGGTQDAVRSPKPKEKVRRPAVPVQLAAAAPAIATSDGRAPPVAETPHSTPSDPAVVRAMQDLESLLDGGSPPRALSIDRELVFPSGTPAPSRPDGDTASKTSSSRPSVSASATSRGSGGGGGYAQKYAPAVNTATSHPVPPLTPQVAPPSQTLDLCAKGALVSASSGLLLELATCRTSATTPSYIRADVEKENERKLAELGKELYRKQQRR